MQCDGISFVFVIHAIAIAGRIASRTAFRPPSAPDRTAVIAAPTIMPASRHSVSEPESNTVRLYAKASRNRGRMKATINLGYTNPHSTNATIVTKKIAMIPMIFHWLCM